MTKPRRATAVVQIEGHIVDSDILSEVFDLIIKGGGKFEIKEFVIGKTNVDTSTARLEISAPAAEKLELILNLLTARGCYIVSEETVTLKKAPKNSSVPDDFYSTTNHQTEIRINGRWVAVKNQRMDGVIVVTGSKAEVKKLREVIKGDLVVTGLQGIRVKPEFKERGRSNFGFMSNEVSSEKKVSLAVNQVAHLIRNRTGRLVVVAGPVVVHTGAVEPLSSLIRNGYVDALLSGNALAVHDIENALFGTSLGIDTSAGTPVDQGHRNHMRAINQINLAGGIQAAVRRGVLKSGVMFECVKRNIPYVLAGSLRDDGPLPETITDMNAAQEAYAKQIKGAEIVLMLSTMLHSIATGNMLPSWVKTICVDINPSVVTKLADRGSAQALGIVTDVGLFCHLLSEQLK
jgi:lysine-ketoglutarate reductase/saccharopine dehydrogenase-like protein (TIGR00300 family)